MVSIGWFGSSPVVADRSSSAAPAGTVARVRRTTRVSTRAPTSRAMTGHFTRNRK
jgi:hypothetical protein